MMRSSTLPTMLLLALMALTMGLPAIADTGQTSASIFLVRHAEKTDNSEDPGLTPAGRQRAEALASALKDAEIEHIYSTDYLRTLDTAAPSAQSLNLSVVIYDPNGLQDLAEVLLASGQNSLVVGHSDTTPEVVKLLGGDPGTEIDEKSEYDRLYVVTVGADGVSSVLLRYGPQ